MAKPTFLDPILRRAAGPQELRTSRNRLIASIVVLAGDSASRRKGLLSRAEFPAGEALIIAPCNAVHTFFMKFPVDLLYVARDGRVLKIRERVAPWRMSGCLTAFATIELPTGTIAVSEVETGDTLHLSGIASTARSSSNC